MILRFLTNSIFYRSNSPPQKKGLGEDKKSTQQFLRNMSWIMRKISRLLAIFWYFQTAKIQSKEQNHSLFSSKVPLRLEKC